MTSILDRPTTTPRTPSVDQVFLTYALDHIEAEEWQSMAICTQTDPEAFFPERGAPAKNAKRVCADCPVRQECLEYALENNETHGIWGGLSESQRAALRRERT